MQTPRNQTEQTNTYFKIQSHPTKTDRRGTNLNRCNPANPNQAMPNQAKQTPKQPNKAKQAETLLEPEMPTQTQSSVQNRLKVTLPT